MRILQINTLCKSGSTGKITYAIHKGLLKNEHESVVCYGRGTVIEDPDIYKVSSVIGVNTHGLIARVSGVNGIASNAATHSVIKIIKKFNPDIVHLHNLHGYYVNMYKLLSYLKDNRIKTVWTLHDDYMFTGNCGGFYLCDKWHKGCGKCENIREYPKSLLFDFTKLQFKWKKRTFEGFDNLTLITPSEWLRDRVRQSFLKDKAVHIIHNGIDTEHTFYPRAYESLKRKHGIKDEKIVLSVMSDFLDEKKGGRYILELAERLYLENIKLIIIGVNKPIKLPDNIITIARTENQEELASYYSMADVFVMTSQCENFPTVCLEALACGAPIVGFDTGGSKETTPNGLGYFVPFGDIKALGDKVLKLIKENNGELSNKCSNYAKESYSEEKMINSYMKVYLSSYL